MCGSNIVYVLIERVNMKQKRLQYKIAVWLTMGLMIVDPLVVPFVYAENPIEVDRNAPHERQAMIGQAANGVTLVNVVGPSAGGVSRNDYTNFNVPQNGVILNNSYQMSNTKLGGYVPGNANMMRGSANVIVNEVTSHNATNMNGFIEVAGHKASVVIANPNGITVDGGGFINTDRAVLTTGKPEYDSAGNLNSYRVERGTVAINRNGLNAKDANSLQVLTEAASVNAGVWANSIEARTGKNKIDANTLDTQKLGNSNNIGLDVSAIGGMYANSITLKGTNTGLGVNVKGVVSSSQASSITSDGQIVVDGGVTSNGNTILDGQSIAIHSNAVVQGDSSTTVYSQEKVNNSGLVNSGNTTTINAKSIDNHEGGRIYGDTVAIKANIVTNHTNSEIEQRYHKAGKELEKAKNELDAEWNADISKYKTKPELEEHRQRIKDLTKAYDDVQEKVTAIKVELDSHKSGVIAGRNHVNITSDTIDNTGKGLIYSGGTMDLKAKQGINNTGATIKSVKSIELDTPVVNNKNVALGVKRVSDGITKNPDKIKVTHPHHKLEGQVFDKSEFPYADDSSGYGVAHIKPVKTPEDEAYNKEMNKNENRINQFTIIRSEAEQTHKKVTNDDPGIISSGGDLITSGILYNDNSRVISGGTFKTNGSIQNISDMISDKTFITGTTQESRTEKKRKRHGYRSKRIRVWGPEVFMTPSITEENVKPIGTIKEHAEDRVSNATIKKVNDSLDPYGLGGGKGKASQTIDGLSLPTEALYQIHPDITANALIETDPAFTNRKNFLSSQFMIDALANNPERRSKRLGDGFYEQQLINEQIVSATGKQYLEGYTDNEAEYKALLEAGVAFGKAFKLTPGIALSKEQMDAITTDMVWLETKTVIVDGKAQQVLYPKVYLAKQSAKSMDTMGGIISGKAIVSNANTDILNQGIMTADTIVLGALDVENTGRIDGRTVTIKASQDVINTGNIHGDKQVYINAGRDINVGTQVDRLQHQDVVGRQGTIGVGEKGDLVLSAKRDINLKGAIVHTGDNSKVSIDAGQNINVTTEALSAKKDMTVNSDNYNRTDRRTELGTAILSDSNVTLRAGNDVNIRNGIVNSEHGLTSVEAGNDVTITNGKSYSRDEYGLKYKEKSLLSRTTNIIRTDHEHTGVLSSTIGGDTINVKANRNVSVTGSNILGTNDVLVSAGNDVRTDSGEETQRDDVYQYSKKSGLMGAGIGFTIGSKKVTDTTDGRYINQVASNIASSDGEINVKAGNAIHSTTTNYFSNQPADLSAQNVTVDGKHNTVHIVQSHEEKRSGLTVSVGGQIVNELNNVQQLGKRANSRKNSNLSTLEYLEAANTLKHAYNDGTSYKNAKIEKLLEKEKDILAKADELNKAYQAEHPEEKNAMHPDVKNRQDLNYDISQLLFTNAYGYDEDTRWSKLREKVAYYYALMEYERDYHDYYDSDNLVHTTDGGHIGEPYYTDESYSALLNNLFAYVVGSDPNNINYYTHLKEYYYNKFVSEEKYIQDKGYNVRTYDAGWQEDDGQYYNKLINGGTVLNGRFRGKQLELEGYPTVLGDDGQTYYTLDENGRPWYNPNPSNEVKIQLSKEKQQLLVTQRLHKINENSKIESNNESYTVQDGEKALESLYNQIPKIRKQYNGAAEATEIFLYAGDKSDLIGKYGIVDVKGSTNDIQTVVIDKDSVLGQTMVPSERMKLDAIVAFMTILKEKGINIDNTGQSTINSHLGVQSVNQYLTVGTYLISPRVFYDEYNDVYYGTMIVADRWDNGGKLAKLGIISFGEYNNPIHNAYVIQVTNLRKPYNNEVHDIPFSVSGRAVRERL